MSLCPIASHSFAGISRTLRNLEHHPNTVVLSDNRNTKSQNYSLACSLKCCICPCHFPLSICQPSIIAQPYHSGDRPSHPWCVLTYLLPSNFPQMRPMQKSAHAGWNVLSGQQNQNQLTVDGSVQHQGQRPALLFKVDHLLTPNRTKTKYHTLKYTDKCCLFC